VIKSLNGCFLAWTDKVIRSKWVQHDWEALKELKEIVEEFINISKVSEASCHEEPRSRTPGQDRELTTFPVPSEDIRGSIGLRDDFEVWRDSLADKPVPSIHPLGYTFAGEIQPHHEGSTPNNYNNKVTSNVLLPKFIMHSRVFLPRAMPPPFGRTGVFPQKSPEVDAECFAQRLHVSCVRAAYRLACEPEVDPKSSSEFSMFIVFSTHERISKIFSGRSSKTILITCSKHL